MTKIEIKQMADFDSISHRVIYGLNMIYSEFAPIGSKSVSEQNQKNLHEFACWCGLDIPTYSVKCQFVHD